MCQNYVIFVPLTLDFNMLTVCATRSFTLGLNNLTVMTCKTAGMSHLAFISPW